MGLDSKVESLRKQYTSSGSKQRVTQVKTKSKIREVKADIMSDKVMQKNCLRHIGMASNDSQVFCFGERCRSFGPQVAFLPLIDSLL